MRRVHLKITKNIKSYGVSHLVAEVSEGKKGEYKMSKNKLIIQVENQYKAKEPRLLTHLKQNMTSKPEWKERLLERFCKKQ